MSRMVNTSETMSTSATKLVGGNPNRTLLTFTNNGAVTVCPGGSKVSSLVVMLPQRGSGMG